MNSVKASIMYIYIVCYHVLVFTYKKNITLSYVIAVVV